jgi:Peptidase family C25
MKRIYLYLLLVFSTLSLYAQPTYNSILSEGQVQQVAMTESGVYRLSYDFLKNELGFSDIDNLPSSGLHVYGGGGGMLPTLVGTPRFDDLVENAIYMVDGGDGSLDQGDYALFYAQGPRPFKYNATTNQFDQAMDIYCDSAYYYIKMDQTQGLRISNTPFINQNVQPITESDFMIRHEVDLTNLLAINQKAVTQGSGQQWFGDYFGEVVRSRDYNIATPGRLNGAITGEIVFAGSSSSSSQVKLVFDGQTVVKNCSTSNPSSTAGTVAALNADRNFDLNQPAGENITFTIEYPSNGADNNGWLDYIELIGMRSIVLGSEPLEVFNRSTINQTEANFKATGFNANTLVWDITTPTQVKQKSINLVGSEGTWNSNENASLARFLVFDPATALIPINKGRIDNQNLHGIETADMIIVYAPEFEEAALKLAEHRLLYNNFIVHAVPTNKIYHEFGNGRPDPVSLRDFFKMVYDRDPNLQNVLLLGDGSFDARGRLAKTNNTAFIPVMETESSLNGIASFPWDDFFTLYDANEGQNPGVGNLELAIGRLPVTTPVMSMQMVDKIIRYETNPNRFGNWRNRITFVADDGDTNLHTRDCNTIADQLGAKFPAFSIDKIFIDAFPKVPGAGGQRSPESSDAINRDMFQGLLAMVYMGHGGPSGWAQERILRQEFIDTWSNSEEVPVMITATCTFSGYDNPFNVSAGEQCFLNPVGGPVALLTTVRAVFTDSNRALTAQVCDTLFNKYDNQPITVGQAIRSSKNDLTGSTSSLENVRRFTLLGDPAMGIAVPRYNVMTTEINGQGIDIFEDTIKALQTVVVKGAVTDLNGIIKTDFNGTVYPTVFDKVSQLTTLGQEPNVPYNFKLQNNKIFTGSVSVTDGLFEFTFVVPLDINYEVGQGKISYYANNEAGIDANGYQFFDIGGGAFDIQDDQPPVVEVFINNWNFQSGGVSDDTPTLLAKISDDLGINSTGTSIGHDLTYTLNADNETTRSINDFFETNLDNHTSGTVAYPLSKLPEGHYTITVRAWDVANNTGVGQTEFIVSSSASEAVYDIFCYPNPFLPTHDAEHFVFSHNYGTEALDIELEIYTLQGTLVHVIEGTINSNGGKTETPTWDGLDAIGANLPHGVYLFRIRAAKSGSSLNEMPFSTLERLVLIK